MVEISRQMANAIKTVVMSYEGEVSNLEAIAALEWVKLELFHNIITLSEESEAEANNDT